MAFLNESHIEEADINLFVDALGYTHINAKEKQLLGRNSLKEVVLKNRLKIALRKLNVHLPLSCIDYAISEITKSRATMAPVLANKEVYELIKKGVEVSFKNNLGREENDYVKIIDFSPENENDFLLVSQLSIEYQQTQSITRRPDLLLYVNGLPLVMIELKNATEKVKTGYDKNLKDYQRDIPQLFCTTCLYAFSMAFKPEWVALTQAGIIFSWLKLEDAAINDDQPTKDEIEKESERTGEHLSLKIFGEGLCRKDKLIDYFENFVLYHKNKVKIIAKT
ncbi:MAG: type I restriction endonuclease subunit R, partial [Bacteroidales bacterium]|nr:type I restriction endonuclease subunit R [Bacteroidales bacterium]